MFIKIVNIHITLRIGIVMSESHPLLIQIQVHCKWVKSAYKHLYGFPKVFCIDIQTNILLSY
jgi:hypothetical protein